MSTYNNGSSNHVVVSDDAGTGFFLDDVLDAPSFCWDSFQVGGTLVCQTNDSHYVSSDGIAWSASPTGGLPTEFIGGDTTRFFAGKSGLYYSTTNGTSWSGVVGWPANVSMTGAAHVGSNWHVTAYGVTTGEYSLRSSSDLSTWSAKRVGGQASCSKFLGTSARLLCLSPEGIASLPLP